MNELNPLNVDYFKPFIVLSSLIHLLLRTYYKCLTLADTYTRWPKKIRPRDFKGLVNQF